MSDERYDVIVVGGGGAGAVCAATLALRGVRTLLVAETKLLGHNMRSLDLDGHRAIIQHPLWHFAYGGGHWARVIREQNLAAPVHVTPHPVITVRGSGTYTELPVLMSAKGTCDAIFKLIPFAVPDEMRTGVERVLHAGLSLPPEQLFTMHDVSLADWLRQLDADEFTAMILTQLAASLTGLPKNLVGDHFSVYGTLVHLRVFLSGEGLPTFIEPDTQLGFMEPLAARVEAFGGVVWRGTKVDRIIIEDGRAAGIAMDDGRRAAADTVAVAVGNPRMPAILRPLPDELEAPLTKEGGLVQRDLITVALLGTPVVDRTTYLMISDVGQNTNLWFVPLHALAPWNCPDDRQLCLVWAASSPETDAAYPTQQAFLKYLDEVCEEEFPGWMDAVVVRKEISHRHHWMAPCYTGPKVPRRSPTVDGLWYVGEGSEPVRGIGLEQAAFAGYDGALRIATHLGHTELQDVLAIS